MQQRAFPFHDDNSDGLAEADGGGDHEKDVARDGKDETDKEGEGEGEGEGSRSSAVALFLAARKRSLPLRRIASFREAGSPRQDDLLRKDERRGSLKAFANSIWERKGSRGRRRRPSKSNKTDFSSGKGSKPGSRRPSSGATSWSSPVSPVNRHWPENEAAFHVTSDAQDLKELTEMTRLKVSPGMKALSSDRSSSESVFDARDSASSSTRGSIREVTTEDFLREYDIVQKVGEGWSSRVYLTEHRHSRQELVLKAINSNSVSVDEFLREYRYGRQLSAHGNILQVFDIVFETNGNLMFATEYAPFGDLTSNVGDHGIGETNTKAVARQIGSALEFVHSKKLCHLDVKLDNILVFKSDFSLVKLCDFSSVRRQGDLVVKKNERMSYCPPELEAMGANERYEVDRAQDVFQFGIVIFFCLFGILPWQRADVADPNYSEFFAWRTKKTSKPPKNFKPMTSRGQKLFRKLMDVEPDKRLALADLSKFVDDKWTKKPGKLQLIPPSFDPAVGLSDAISQVTMGSFQSVHSNAVEKNRILFTLLQHGVETTVDRSQKNSRIINWIQHGYTLDGKSAPALPPAPPTNTPSASSLADTSND